MGNIQNCNFIPPSPAENPFDKTIVITNRVLVSGDYMKQIKYALSLHPYALILREKDLSEEEYFSLAESIQALCDKEGVEFFIHSHVNRAMELGYPNIHIGIGEIPLNNLAFSQISVSCHSISDVELAEQAGATQIVLGTIFETDCKPGLAGKGIGFVKEICDRTALPVFAIGGITLKNLPLVQEAGAYGGCMMSYYMTKK